MIHRAVPAVLLACLLAGCRSAPEKVPYARAYPGPLKQSAVLNVQVIRRDTTVDLTNTTARAFGPSTLWLNRRFCRPLESWAVGERLSLPLREFRDEHSTKFRAGGFFAAEPAQKLVMAQIETLGEAGTPVMLGLIVVETGEEETR